jgi:gliding motility-associated-like protein
MLIFQPNLSNKMKRIVLLTFLIVASITSKSQNLSYTCPRDTVLGCNTACFTLTARIPDLKSSTTNYTLKNVTSISACRPYIGPGVPGLPTELTIDDRYSAGKPIGFNFPFYDSVYQWLVVSTNGYVSFDTSTSLGFSAWSLAGGNFPSTGYDRALIAGPWHDLDPSVPNSPTLRVNFTVVGAAPTRKWVLSIYKLPLFQAACNPLIENTQQIVLHESTGLIECFIVDKQQCPSWNNGRGMVGIQDYTRTKALVAPGRAATDAPWGSIGMNEVWRFYPAVGPTLYRSVQLLDGTGAVVATGDTTRIDATTFETSFPNVCPPTGSSIYVVKTTYQKIDNPGMTIYSLDTINVTRQAALPVSATMTATTCGTSTGSVTVTAVGTGPFIFSIDGGATTSPQATGIYTFPNIGYGPHTVYAEDGSGCNNTANINVTSVGSLTSSISSTATSCPGLNNGSVTATPGTGTAPYTFSLFNGVTQIGASQATGTFTGLAPSTYTVQFTDVNGCSGTTSSVSVNTGTALTMTITTVAVSCTGANNGQATINPTSGTAPYTYEMDGNGVFQASNVFTNLLPGTHNVLITDANGCTGRQNLFIGSGSGLASSTPTTTATTCPGVNNGSITIVVTNGTAPFTFVIDGGAGIVQPTGTYTFTNLASGSHTITFTDVTGCSGTRTVTVAAGSGLGGNAVSTAASCPGVSNGTVTATPSSGIAPYTYSVDGGPYQASPTFTGLSAGVHTVTFIDANGCTGTASVTVLTGAGINGTTSSTATSCPAVNNGTATAVPTTGTAPYTFSIDGGPFQASATFTGLASGPHSIIIQDAAGCQGTVNVTVNTGASITGTGSTTATSCPSVNNGTATATPTSGTAPYTYSIDGGPFQAGATFSGLASGPHSLIIQDAAGCQGTVTVSVNPGVNLTGTAAATPTSCPTVNNGSVTATPASGTAPYTYSLGGGPSQASPTFGGLAPGSYTITFTDAIGCTGTASATVTAGSNISSTVTGVNPPCANINDGTITITPTSGTVPYLYSINGGPTQPGASFGNLSPGIYNIAISDALGCTGTNTFTLTTNAALATTVSFTMPLCYGNANGIITLSPSGGVSPYEFATGPAFTNWQSSGAISNLSTGTYTIRIRDNVGCIKDTTVFLDQPPFLSASATSTPGTCNGNDGQILVNALGGTTPYSYSIDNGVTYQASSTFIVSGGNYPNIKVKDVKGCIANTSVNVVLIDNMVLTPLNDTTICVDQSMLLQPILSNEATLFNWSTIPDPALISSLNDSTIRNPIATPADTTIYTLEATWGVCKRYDSIRVNVLHRPIALAGNDVWVCNYKRDTILVGSATNLSGPVHYEWSPPETALTPYASTTIVNPDSTQPYTLTVYDDYGCNFAETDVVVVRVQPPVPAYAGHDTLAVSGAPHQLMASGGVSYLWSPAYPLNLSTAQNPIATLTHDQLFVVTVTDDKGCLGNDSVFIQVYAGPCYYVPSSFTPNGDGLNDIFRAIPVGIAYTDWFRVFNRYGELVFQTNRWMKGWDGTYLGKKQPAGTYVWIVKGVDKYGKVVEQRGTVLIIQ